MEAKRHKRLYKAVRLDGGAVFVGKRYYYSVQDAKADGFRFQPLSYDNLTVGDKVRSVAGIDYKVIKVTDIKTSKLFGLAVKTDKGWLPRYTYSVQGLKYKKFRPVHWPETAV